MISTRPLPSRSCRSAVKDGRTGAATTSYLAKTALVSGIDNPGPDDLAYAYNAHGRLSRIDRSKSATTNISTYLEYNTRGQVTRRWGSAATPIEYAYDGAYGHLTHQKTYRAGSGWESSSSWPSSPGTADTTQWEVDAATGLLKKKIDAANNEVRFEYNDRGQLKKRILARDSNGNAATQYRYDANTAELSTVDYPGTMTDIVYTYTRLGALKSVVDATTGTRTFTFRTSDYQLASEQLPSGFYGTKRFLSPVYSTASGTNGRLTGLKYGTSVGSSSALSVTYGYEGTTGRLRTVGAHNKTMTYRYQSNSNLVNQVSSGSYAMTRTWESDRNLVTSVATAWGSTSKVLHRYHYDALNRRTAEFKRGEMFDIYGGTSAVGIGRKYQYDDNAGLISAIDYLDPDADYQTADLSTRVKGRRFGYAYDNQGNRTTSGTTVNYRESAESNLRTANYTVNNRNQYTQRQVPAYVDVAGASSGTVTVSGTATAGTTVGTSVSHTVTKQSDYFYSLLDDNGTNGYDNADDDLKVTVSVSAGGELNEGEVHIAQTPEAFTYDADGNLTSDGLWDYTWDAENRLTAMTMKTGLPTGMTRKRLEFKYDYLGRRVEKKVIDHWDVQGEQTTVTHLRYVYDGHNLIAELDASTTNKTVLSTYVWGLDLSGTTWGAGGVGGLLMIKDGSKVYFPGYDGNGNVSALLDSADGSLDAKYEYGAFGEPLRVSGTAIAADNPFRFSTKYTDVESGLVYYGFRYYSPSLGRFLNRDPLGELGGSNLYGFVENDPVNGWDYLGLDIIGKPSLDDCASQCTSYSAEFEYRSFRECMEDRCPGLLLDDFEVKENKVRNWGGQSTNLGLILSAGGGGGGGGGGDGGGPSGDDGCNEEKEEDDRPFWCAAIEGAFAANRNIGAAHARLLGLLGIDSKFTFGGSAGYTFAFPFTSNLLGGGFHVDGGGGFSIDFSNPLNTRGFASASGSLMATFGGASYWNYGPVFGISETPIEAGFSVQDHLHIESAAIFGATGLGAQADILLDEVYEVFRDSFELEEIIDGFNVSVSPRGGAGFAAFAGVGRGMSVSLGLPSFKEKMQRAYDRECR